MHYFVILWVSLKDENVFFFFSLSERMFVKHELVVTDHETMHKCWAGVEDWDFKKAYFSQEADILQGFYGDGFVFMLFFLKGWRKEVERCFEVAPSSSTSLPLD